MTMPDTTVQGPQRPDIPLPTVYLVVVEGEAGTCSGSFGVRRKLQ